ncbi:MAG: NPCBM/NEW2 domain-containing protein [Sedimentisphaerales bacterium]|nr:NPCBM/NEW2 domain-containing protein [Sedimentisphaerales bacterium]
MELKRDDIRLSELILASLEGTIQPDEFEELQRRIESSPESAKAYVDFMLNHAIVGHHAKTNPVGPSASDSAVINWQFWNELAETEKSSPTVAVIESSPEETKIFSVRDSRVERVTHSVNRFFLLTAIVSSAALILLIALAYLNPAKPQPAAVIIDTLNAKWMHSTASPAKGDVLFGKNESVNLLSGIVKMEFAYGARVILEGPATFKTVSPDKMVLESGRMYASVPVKATGFTVMTPSSSVIDLGTEFGVEVDFAGSTNVHMFYGKTSLLAGALGNVQASRILETGQAKRVNPSGHLQDIPLNETGFVRALDSRTHFVWRGEKINLADIIGGGDGLGTGTINQGIDVETGKAKLFEKATTSLHGKSQYVTVADNPLIDGVFIPIVQNGKLAVSSKGHAVDNFPQSAGDFWNGIFNGGWHEASNFSVPRHNLKLQGNEYGNSENPSIYMHASQGITFDLHAIRQHFPGLEIDRFETICGISESLLEHIAMIRKKMPNQPLPTAGFHVLLDGRIKFSRDLPAGQNEIISIPISSQDQFLTLVTTEGPDGTHFNDWALFAEPYLYLEP